VTDWLHALRSERAPSRWAFLGHSMGALVALDWTLRNPGVAEALVLSAPPFELALHPSSFKVHAARVIGHLWPGFTQGNEIPPSLLSHDPEVIRAHRADPHVHYRISARLFLELQTVRRALAKNASEPTIPTLLIQGQADPVTSCAGCAQWAKGRSKFVTYREFPGLYHEVLNEREGPAILNEIVDWLSAVMRVVAPA
jgi:acylglycerol lipase